MCIRDRYYRTRITDADGKRVAIYGLTREELYDRVEDAQKKIAEVVFHRENPTVEEYCEKWLLMRSGTVRTNTLEGYARMVNRYIVGPIGQMYMDEVTTDDLRLLMVPLSKGSSGMYGQLNMLIKNIFNSAEESKVIKAVSYTHLGSAGLAFRHKALPIWRKPHFLCLQRIISGNTRFVR